MLNKIYKAIYIPFLVVFPLFCLNAFYNPYDLPKNLLLFAFFALTLIFLGFEILTSKGKLNFKLSSLDIPLLILTLAYLISGIIKTPNKMEVFFFPGTVITLLIGFVIYFLGKRSFKDKENQLPLSLFFSALIVSLVSIFGFLEITNKVSFLPTFVKESPFSPLGGKLPEVIFLVSMLPIGVLTLTHEKEFAKKMLYGFCILLIVLATTLDVSFILPGRQTAPILAGWGQSWSIAFDSLKESPILGVGPANYLTAYGKFVPISNNSGNFWLVRFASGRNFIFTLITETGFLGMIGLTLLLFLLVKAVIKNFREASTFSVLTLALAFFVFPTNVTLITIFLILASFIPHSKDWEVKIPKFVGVLLLILVGAFLFFAAQAFAAERYFKMGLDAVNKNEGKLAYDSLRNAVNTNPYIDRYHATYSQVNSALAKSLSQKSDIREGDKETIAQLIQQAVREARSTVALNPQRASNWELLARTYQTIVPFAEGADNFAIQTFNQAISLDPTNPNLRIGLGGVYFALGRYDEAIDAFKLAVVTKPDLANAHYNLAIAYKEKKEIGKAIDEMNTVLAQVSKDSPDYKLALDELSNLKKNKTELESGSSENLTPPQKVEETTPIEQIDLQP